MHAKLPAVMMRHIAPDVLCFQHCSGFSNLDHQDMANDFSRWCSKYWHSTAQLIAADASPDDDKEIQSFRGDAIMSHSLGHDFGTHSLAVRGAALRLNLASAVA